MVCFMIFPLPSHTFDLGPKIVSIRTFSRAVSFEYVFRGLILQFSMSESSPRIIDRFHSFVIPIADGVFAKCSSLTNGNKPRWYTHNMCANYATRTRPLGIFAFRTGAFCVNWKPIKIRLVRGPFVVNCRMALCFENHLNEPL